RIGFYLHIPFPTSDAFFAIPHNVELLADLAAYDLIGLQAQRDATALREVIDSPVTPSFTAAPRRPANFSRTHIEAIAIGSDPDAFAGLAGSPSARKMIRRLKTAIGDSALILGVDRLDYSKGLPQRIEAYEKLLEANPDLRRKVHLLQIAPPS